MGEDPSFDLSRPTLPENYLIAIGNVSYQWGVLEMVMEVAISKLSGLQDSDPRSVVMIAHMSWPQRMNVLGTLVNMLAPEHKNLERFPEVKSLLEKAQKGRNRIAHAKLENVNGKVYISTLSARGTLKISIEPILTTEIDAVRSDIGNAGVEPIKLIINK